MTEVKKVFESGVHSLKLVTVGQGQDKVAKAAKRNKSLAKRRNYTIIAVGGTAYDWN